MSHHATEDLATITGRTLLMAELKFFASLRTSEINKFGAQEGDTFSFEPATRRETLYLLSTIPAGLAASADGFIARRDGATISPLLFLVALGAVVLGMLWLVQFVLRNEEKRTRGG